MASGQWARPSARLVSGVNSTVPQAVNGADVRLCGWAYPFAVRMRVQLYRELEVRFLLCEVFISFKFAPLRLVGSGSA